jgi:integrase
MYWLKGRNPVTGKPVRISLQTTDEARAALLHRKWEAWAALFVTEFGGTDLPPRMREELRGLPPGFAVLLPGYVASIPVVQPAVLAAPAGEVPQPLPEPPLLHVLRKYLRFCESENSQHHAANKASILKAAFGAAAVEDSGALDGPLACARLSDLSASLVQAFIEGRRKEDGSPLSVKTRRHYREVFCNVFEYAMRHGDYVPKNLRYPNPMGAGLPSYQEKNRVIEFLDDDQIAVQLEALRPYPVLHAAVGTMIYSGPRRNECLWLQANSIEKEKYLSIRNLLDEESETRNSLKTGARTVAIEPELMAIFRAYLPTLKGPWLFPSPNARRWDKDHFSTALREANAAAGLTWSSMHYRHTYATRNARAGVSVFALARAMGTSVAMIESYYAGFFPPSAIGALPATVANDGAAT